jgi:hypothetical protein
MLLRRSPEELGEWPKALVMGLSAPVSARLTREPSNIVVACAEHRGFHGPALHLSAVQQQCSARCKEM